MNFDVSLVLALVTAHLLADFVFQSGDDLESKKRVGARWRRVAIVAGLSYVLAGDWRAWWVATVIAATRFVLDWLKTRRDENRADVFVADQAAHLLVILAMAWRASIQSAWIGLWPAEFNKVLVLLGGIVLTVKVGGVVVGMQVKPYLNELTKPPEESAIFKTDKQARAKAERGLPQGGKVIGQLERGLIFFLVGIGKPEAVAFLVAAKSIFRFGDLVDRKRHAEAEYITIGTLMSFTWGLVAAWLTWWVYGLL